MKNTHSPTPENFILTQKKIRMIKALMKQFAEYYSSSTYSDCNYAPEPKWFEIYMKEHLKFLKNIQPYYLIEMINGKFTGIQFQFEDFVIFAKTPLRQSFIKPALDIKDYEYIEFRCLKIENPKP